MLDRVVLALHLHALPLGDGERDRHAVGHGLGSSAGRLLGRRVAGGERVGHGLVGAAVRERLDAEGAERVEERGLRMRQGHAVLRPARPRERRLHGREVELHDLRVRRLLLRPVPEQVLLAVGLHERDPLVGPPGQAQVLDRLLVDREEAAGGAVLRGHVPDRRPVGERETCEPVAEVLDELADDAGLTQDLGHRQDEVGRRRALDELAAELEADDLRYEHRQRLAEHRRLRLDPADAPAEHAEAVHHRRVGVGADERVGEREPVA